LLTAAAAKSRRKSRFMPTKVTRAVGGSRLI
jgi:hypothetical protein